VVKGVDAEGEVELGLLDREVDHVAAHQEEARARAAVAVAVASWPADRSIATTRWAVRLKPSALPMFPRDTAVGDAPSAR
jgi:hypothetical protein